MLVRCWRGRGFLKFYILHGLCAWVDACGAYHESHESHELFLGCGLGALTCGAEPLKTLNYAELGFWLGLMDFFDHGRH